MNRFLSTGIVSALYRDYPAVSRMAENLAQRSTRLETFDGADPNASTPTRQSTTVPTQALYFINDPIFHTQAAGLASRLLMDPSDEVRMREVYRTLFQREPSQRERERARRFFENYPGDVTEKWSALSRVLLASNEFLFVE